MKARLKTWWQQRNRRERWLAALTALVLIAALVELIALAPQRAARAQAQREIAASLTDLERLKTAAAGLAARRSPNDATDALAARRQRAQASIDRAQVDLIAPQDMARQLAAILARHPQLRVVGLQSSPPKAVDLGNARASTTLYEHELRIDVEGRYLDLLAYLEALQQAPHRIFWRSLDMNAAGQVPVTRIELFTLSKEPVWLRL